MPDSNSHPPTHGHHESHSPPNEIHDDRASPRRRPVDALFGEDVELDPKRVAPEPHPPAPDVTPGYVVEPAKPPTQLNPPPPELPGGWTPPPQQARAAPVSAAEPRAPAPKPAPAPAPASSPALPKTAPPSEPLPVVPTPPVSGSPAPAPAAHAPAAPVVQPVHPELITLSQFIDQLYRNVADELSDSQALSDECHMLLRAARQAVEARDFALAEYNAEQVRSRLLRARASRQAGSSLTLRFITLWLGLCVAASAVVIALPLLLRLVPEVVPVLRAVGLGALGACGAALWNMAHYLSRRVYDPAHNLTYAVAPFRGIVAGAVLYVLSLLGVVAAPGALGMTLEPFLLLYLFALLGGLASDALLDALRGAVAALVRKKA